MTKIKESDPVWCGALAKSIDSYRRTIDATVSQLSDEELNRRPNPNFNSVAVLLRHLGGNLRSRWTDFLTTDGEKPDRNRDSEFSDWEGDRASLLAWFDEGWCALNDAVQQINDAHVNDTIFIRGEPHSVGDALVRSVTHIGYHVGQIALIARMVHDGEWKWLTIAPGASATHNEKTWGTPASRGPARHRLNENPE